MRNFGLNFRPHSPLSCLHFERNRTSIILNFVVPMIVSCPPHIWCSSVPIHPWVGKFVKSALHCPIVLKFDVLV